VIDALTVLVEPDREQLRCSSLETARRLRLITMALSSHRLAATDPLPPEEIVSLLLDGLRRRDEAPARSAQPTLAMEVPAC
jgi:hypothetical protein